MKRIYFFLAFILATFLSAQSVAITAVVDGTLPSDGCAGVSGDGQPGFIELYVSGSVDFTGYAMETKYTIGSTSIWTGKPLTGLGVREDTFVYIASVASVTFTEMYGITADLIIDLPADVGDGNDAYRIVDASGTVIDQFGDPNQIADGSDFSAPWCYRDSYAKRNNKVLANGGTFVQDSFTYGGNDAFAPPNNTCDFIKNAVPLGTFILGVDDLQSSLKNKVKFSSTVVSDNITIYSEGNTNVEMYNTNGQLLKSTSGKNEISINTSSLSNGVYVLKISQNGETFSQKIIKK